MSRLPRLAIAGQPHLILQRGVASQPVFVDDEDRRLFMTRLAEAAGAHRVSIHAYVLLDAEVQLLGTPAEPDSLSRMMQALGRTYVANFNRRHLRTGTLWEGRFRATVIEPEPYLLAAMRFVETRPRSMGLDPHDYAWSSAAHHVGRRVSSLIADHPAFWKLGNTPFDREAAYSALLGEPLGAPETVQIEQAVAKGWALGSTEFLRAMRALTSRRLEPLPRGRPRIRKRSEINR